MPSATLAVPRVHFENAAGRVLEHSAGCIGFAYHAGPRQAADLQVLIRHTGSLLLRTGWRHILGNQRLMTPLTPEESAWLVAYWQQHTQRHPGRLYAAVVLAEDVFARLSASQLKQDIRAADIIYRHFTDEQTAAAWLMQQA